MLFTEEVPSEPRVTHAIRGRQPVGGIATLGQDVFISRYNSQQIEVYSATSLSLRRHLIVPGLGPFSFDLDTCAADNSLLLSDYYNDSVHRVELSGNHAVMKWAVARHPVGLSVMGTANHVLVVSERDRKLQVFTTHGNLLRNIRLPGGITSPNHAVQLPSGNLVLCDPGNNHQVCLITTGGRLLSSHTGTRDYVPELTKYYTCTGT